MFRIRKKQVEAFRPGVRAGYPERLLFDLNARQQQAERDPESGDVVVRDARGHATRMSFHPDGLPKRLTQPSGAAYELEHDRQGRLAALTYPGGERVGLSRDDDGRVTSVERPELLAYRFSYDEKGRTAAVQYPDLAAVQFRYDEQDRLTSLIDRGEAETKFHYTEDGRPEVVEDPLGHKTRYRSTYGGMLEAIEFPDGTSEEYAYDPDERVAVVKNRAGEEVAQLLNEQGGLSGVVWPDDDWAAFDYDSAGNLEMAANEAATIEWDYEGEMPVLEASDSGEVRSAYDPEGRLTRLETPFGDAIEYEYDLDGRLALVRDWQGRENRYDWGADGRLQQIRYGNGLTESYEWAPVGRMSEVSVEAGNGRELSRQSYRYDECERLVFVRDVWGEGAARRSARQLSYGPADRIESEQDVLSGETLHSFLYDRKGNLVSDDGIPITYGLMDEPVRYGHQSVQYDRLGNMISLPGVDGEIRCSFAANGLLKSAKVGDRVVRFEYDALCRRVKKTNGETSWRYGWNGHQLLWEEKQSTADPEPARRDYLWLPDSVLPLAFRENGQTYWMQRDARGAVIKVFDEEGRVVWHATYDSFGLAQVRVNRVRQPWRLLGHYHDLETGLDYNHTRYYSPGLRTYLSRDPRWFELEATNYSYARQDPWNRADPFGTIAPLLVAAGAVVVGGLVGGIISAATGGSFWAGAADGAISTAGAIVGGLLGGPVGLVAGGVIGSGLGAFAGSAIEQAEKGEPFCLPCALEAAAKAAAFDLALLGLGKIPGVKRLVKAVSNKLAKLAEPLRKWGKKKLAKLADWAKKKAQDLAEALRRRRKPSARKSLPPGKGTAGPKPPPLDPKARINEMEHTGTYPVGPKAGQPKAHGHSTHGSQTTTAQHTDRVQQGIDPATGEQSHKVPRSTKFDSDAAELEALEKAQAKVDAKQADGKLPHFVVNDKGVASPNRPVEVVNNRPGGYGSGVEVQRGADNRPLPGRPVNPTGQDPNAKVIFEYNPESGKFEPITQFPTNDPVAPD